MTRELSRWAEKGRWNWRSKRRAADASSPNVGRATATMRDRIADASPAAAADQIAGTQAGHRWHRDGWHPGLNRVGFGAAHGPGRLARRGGGRKEDRCQDEQRDGAHRANTIARQREAYLVRTPQDSIGAPWAPGPNSTPSAPIPKFANVGRRSLRLRRRPLSRRYGLASPRSLPSAGLMKCSLLQAEHRTDT